MNQLIIAPDTYEGREQTRAKHFILCGYLQELAFKVLRGWDIAYVDGFSGPWEHKADDYSDTSFMIAINVLKDAQKVILEQTGIRRTIKCFFSENNSSAFRELNSAVAPYHDPTNGFEIKTYSGNFEDAVPEIQTFVGNFFPLVFIDPTGWTGYPFHKIAPLFSGQKCEVLINFMYAFVSRFVSSQDAATVASLDPILGGPGWRTRLDPTLPIGPAVEKLFRETLQKAGNFPFVISTKIDKSTEDRPHFFLAYGTKSSDGLKAFREIEHKALREHARARATAKGRKKEIRTGMFDLLAPLEPDRQEATIDDLVEEQKALATPVVLTILAKNGPQTFASIVKTLLQAFMLRETDVKNICVALAKAGKLEQTWGNGGRKPVEQTLIKLLVACDTK